MLRESFDIVILGAGFAGSILAAIAANAGRRVILLERSRHPRFAIGESSTPLANLKLESLAREFDLHWLADFAKYGTWKRTHPEIACGLKRGFSYFNHHPGQDFTATADHQTELLVAASPNDELGDTHWYREQFDHFLLDRALESGICYRDEFTLLAINETGQWFIYGRAADGPVHIRASFLVDATGGMSEASRELGLVNEPHRLRTSTSALFGHFRDVLPWNDVLQQGGISTADHPFSADASAMHHLGHGFWMWVLRFDNGVTSAGFSLPPSHPTDPSVPPQDQWNDMTRRFPTIARQFQNAHTVQPIRRTGRLQRRLSRSAGPNWALLPHTAGFVDPWFSTGIAHTLFGVQRLAKILIDGSIFPMSQARLAEYETAVFAECEVIDRLTAACLNRLDCFPVMTTLAMLYFVAATHQEERIRQNAGWQSAFLLADDPHFLQIIDHVIAESERISRDDAHRFLRCVCDRLAPYNRVGLCDSKRQNLYPYTTAAT